jgi:hypothetical protein
MPNICSLLRRCKLHILYVINLRVVDLANQKLYEKAVIFVRYLIFCCGFQYIRQKKENALSHNKNRNPDPNVFDNYTKCPSASTFLGWGSISYI